MTTRAQINELLQADPDRYGPVFAAVSGVTDAVAPSAVMNGVHPATVSALLPLMVQGSVLPEDPATIALIEESEGSWQAYGYADAEDYANAQAESLAIIRTVVPDEILDLLVGTAEAFVAAVKASDVLPADHPEVQTQPQVSAEEMLASIFGGSGVEVIDIEDGHPGTYL